MADEPQRESARYTRRDVVKRAGAGAGGLLAAGAPADTALARGMKGGPEAAPQAKPGGKDPFRWTHHFSFGVADFAGAYISQGNGPVKTNKKVGVLYPNDADGNAVRGALAPLLAKAGFTIVDPGPYEDGTTDFSAQITKFKAENCQIFNTFPLPPDFATFWRQATQQGYAQQVKIAQIAKSGLFASEIVALGS